MRLLFTILFIFVGTYCIAYSDPYNILKKSVTNCRTQKQLNERLKHKFKDFSLEEVSPVQRKLDFGFSQTRYWLEVSGRPEMYKIFIVTSSSSDSIVLGTIEEMQGDERLENYIEINWGINNYLSQHKAYYGYDLTKDEFKNQLSKRLIYGFNCSEDGDYNPPEAIQTLNSINNNNYDTLAIQLRQISPELQAYGVYGLLKLKEKGNEIKPKDLELIEYLRKRNTKINSCVGCLTGYMVTLDEIIKRIERSSDQK